MGGVMFIQSYRLFMGSSLTPGHFKNILTRNLTSTDPQQRSYDVHFLWKELEAASCMSVCSSKLYFLIKPIVRVDMGEPEPSI